MPGGVTFRAAAAAAASSTATNGTPGDGDSKLQPASNGTSSAADSLTPATTTTTTWHQKLRSSSPFAAGKPQLLQTKEEIVAQGKCLCGQYMRARLRRAGCLNRKVTLRLRTLLDPVQTLATRDIFPILNTIGEELERMHPRIYTKVSRQLAVPGSPPFGELTDADAAPFLLHTTAKELFKSQPAASAASTTTTTTTTASNNSSPHLPTSPLAGNKNAAAGTAAVVMLPEISWGKIVSLFAMCAALAVDIVHQGHSDYLPRLLEGVADIIEEDLAAWIQQDATATTTDGTTSGGGGGGGWGGLVVHFRTAPDRPKGRGSDVASEWLNVHSVLCSNWASAAVAAALGALAVVQSVQLLIEWMLWGRQRAAEAGGNVLGASSSRRVDL